MHLIIYDDLLEIKKYKNDRYLNQNIHFSLYMKFLHKKIILNIIFNNLFIKSI